MSNTQSFTTEDIQHFNLSRTDPISFQCSFKSEQCTTNTAHQSAHWALQTQPGLAQYVMWADAGLQGFTFIPRYLHYFAARFVASRNIGFQDNITICISVNLIDSIPKTNMNYLSSTFLFDFSSA